jgi:hypothetical protein
MNRAFQIGLAIVVLLFGAIGSIYYFVYRSGQDNGEMRVADQSPSLSQPQIDGMDAEPAGDMGDAVAELDARLLSEAFDVSFTRCGESAPTPNVFLCDTAYSVRYEQGSSQWIAVGDAHNEGYTIERNYNGAPPNDGQIVIWGARFSLHPDGTVYYTGQAVGTYVFSPVDTLTP